MRNPIDQFILQKLETAGLTPAPEADRRTLARRLSLDLTGLPPSPELVEAFVKDSSPRAYEDLVDQLLRSPHWGEHRGRYWLDAARYADTHGIHFDNYREIWAYRDWVISAFNQNLPFDQFTVEQLAGDLLPKRTLEQQIASGFNRCNITTNEGGVIGEEYLVLYTRDRTETTAQVWMGLTAGCAVCHDHKFDPISQREFYSMAAFFNNTTQPAMDGNVKDSPPIVVVPKSEDRQRWNALQTESEQVAQQLDARKKASKPQYEKWSQALRPEQLLAELPTIGLRFHARLDDGSPKTISYRLEDRPLVAMASADLAWSDGYVAPKSFKSRPGSLITVPDAGDFERDQAFSYGAWIRAPKGNITGSAFARMDDQHDYRGWDLWIEGNRVAAHIIHKWPGDALKVVSSEPLKSGAWTHVFVTYDGSGKASGIQIYLNGVRQSTSIAADALKNTIKTKAPLSIAQRQTGSRLNDLEVQDIRLYSRALSDSEVGKLSSSSRAAYLASRSAQKRETKEKEELFDWWLANLDSSYIGLSKRKASLDQATLASNGSSERLGEEPN